MPLPFEASLVRLRADPDPYVDSVFGALDSSFLTMPKGRGFVEYPVFERGYEALKKATRGFREVTADRVIVAATGAPMALVVLRSILGFSPPEWAEVTSAKADLGVDQGFARTLDRKIRLDPAAPVLGAGERTDARIRLLVEAACDLYGPGRPRRRTRRFTDCRRPTPGAAWPDSERWRISARRTRFSSTSAPWGVLSPATATPFPN